MRVINRNGKLSLKNNGELELFFLGTGTPFTKSNFNNNLIIIKGETHLLVDFGINAPIALEKVAGLKPQEINLFLPTHSHSDHVGGIENLILNKRYLSGPGEHKIKTIITDKYKDILWNKSLSGGLEWNEYCKINEAMTFDSYFDQIKPELIQTTPRKIYKIEVEGLQIEMFETNHIPECAESSREAFTSYGLMIDDKLFISCDTKFDIDLINLYKDRAEYFFHDCSIQKNPVHASLEELKMLPKEIKSRMYLMHYDDNWGDCKANDFAGFAKQGHSYLL